MAIVHLICGYCNEELKLLFKVILVNLNGHMWPVATALNSVT